MVEIYFWNILEFNIKYKNWFNVLIIQFPSPGQSWPVLPWSVGVDAGGAEATAERPLVQRVANMDHFLPSDTELSQQVDVVAAKTHQDSF